MDRKLSQQDLCELLKYDPDTGKLYWNERQPKWFPDTPPQGASGRCKQWNTMFAGKEALTHKMRDGHLRGHILNKSYLAHRVIWVIATGEWPEQIDHINGDPSDNRMKNLRNVSFATNMRNLPIPSTNKSGRVGVRWGKTERRWIASIRCDGKQKYLGSFKRFEEACAARQGAEKVLGFHPNHGRALEGGE